MEGTNSLSMNPEIYLGELNRRINKIYLDSLAFGNDKLQEEIRNLLKKTIISEVFNEKYIIAIAGLQGVGKSTIMKILYDLPDDIIPETRSIGERIPVVVTEWEENYYGFKAKIININNKKIEIKDKIIDNAVEFFEISRNPSMEYIILELMVPRKFFKTTNTSFVLLPGINQKNDSWNELAKYVLYSAANSILVFNEQRFNDPNNTSLIQSIKSDFNSAKPIVALTFGDQSADGNVSLKEQFIKQFNVPSVESDRIIRTSTRENDISRWCNEMIAALGKYSDIEKEFRLKQIEVLDQLLLKDLSSILNNMEKKNCSYDLLEDSGSKDSVRRIMNKVNKRKDSIKKYYHKEIEKQIENIAFEASNNMKDYIKDESILYKLKKQIFSESIEDIDQFNNNIMSSWKRAENNKLNTLSYRAIEQTMYNEYPEIKQINGYGIKQLDQEEIAVTTVEGGSNRKLARNKEKIERSIMDIMQLFKVRNGELSGEILESVDYIPLLALHVMLVIDSNFNNLNDTVYSNLAYKNKSEVVDTLGESAKQQLNILNGVAAILGIDATDGTGNIVQDILASLGIQISASASVAITGFLGASLVGINLVSKLNKADIKTWGYSRAIIGSIKEEVYNDMREKFDDLVDKIFNKIEAELEKGFGLNERESRYFICQKDISETRSFGLELREQINGYRCYLG
ncbi:hypothetical protein [Clostridium sp. BL-8]|uniref:hypothetical protein n=1 Tax=Clostridium sp. BL-8 TaxID=349938 RepID=UPI00098CED67|nr:hypothetical protein [Clostridium sp. BL-8]OOM78813.1 hypothetical protein CLOBL_20610 [Clostridium sp. BL-8]